MHMKFDYPGYPDPQVLGGIAAGLLNRSITLNGHIHYTIRFTIILCHFKERNL